MMKRIKGFLIVSSIFVFGVIVGGIIGASTALVDVVHKTFRGPENIRRVLVQRAKQDLHLDDDQAHQFWLVLSETGEELKQVTKPVHKDIRAAMEKAEGKLRNILMPEQKEAFDWFVKESQKRWPNALFGDTQPATTQSAETQ
jgi:hypothetical protein